MMLKWALSIKYKYYTVVSLIFLSLTSSSLIAGDIHIATSEQVSLIGVLLEKGVSVYGSAAIKSPHHRKAYYVGLRFKVPGVDEMVTGVWIVSGDANRPILVLAVDGLSKEFSRATHADQTNPKTASVTDNECQKLHQYFDK